MSQPQMFVDPREVEYDINVTERIYLSESQPVLPDHHHTSSTYFYLQHYDADCTPTNLPGDYAQETTITPSTILTVSHLQHHDADCTHDYDLDDYILSSYTSDSSSHDTDTSSSPAFSSSTSPSTSSHDSPGHSPRPTTYRHQCIDCGRAYPTNGDLRKHRNAMHEKRYKCEECGHRFGLKTDLKKHALTHLRPEEKVGFPCEFVGVDGMMCGKSFPRKDNMQKHMRKLHGAR